MSEKPGAVHPSLLLADEMGLGKTIQAIAALRGLFAFGCAEAALVVAPAGLVLQWRRELRQWAPELRLSTILGSPGARTGLWRAPDAQVFLCGYETIRSDRDDPAVGGREWDVVILDEAQRIKNPHAEISSAVKQLRRRRSWALTGTPLENRLGPTSALCALRRSEGRGNAGFLAGGLRMWC